MRKMTEENAAAAFAGESQAHIKYLNFAEAAGKEGKPNAARLFRAASYSEQVHAGRHLAVLEGVGSTSANLAAAVAGETFEVEEMYPAYIEVAGAQAEPKAAEAFDHARRAEIQHQQFYQRAQQAVGAGGDLAVGEIVVCSYCGYTAEGPAPEKCPVCGNPGKSFAAF
jgi:rubrerythrin